jgi:hypothetical protein
LECFDNFISEILAEFDRIKDDESPLSRLKSANNNEEPHPHEPKENIFGDLAEMEM